VISEEHTALTIAESVGLDKVLSDRNIDGQSFHGAGVLIGGMITSLYREHGILMKGLDLYPGARSAVTEYLGHAEKLAATPEDYRVIEKIVNMTEPGGEFEKTISLDWTEKDRDYIYKKASKLLSDSRWEKTVTKEMESGDVQGIMRVVPLADSIGLDLNDFLLEKLKSRPADKDLWHLLSIRADENLALRLVKFALEITRDEKLKKGVLEIYDPFPPILVSLLDMLYNFPGIGEEIIGIALEHKSSDIKLRGLKVLNNRPGNMIDVNTRGTLAKLASDPVEDEMVGICSQHVLEKCE
jgi:hypothetical protein